MRKLRFKYWISLLLFAGLARHAWAQARYQPRYVEPRWFTFRLSQVTAGAYAEGIYQTSNWEDSDTDYSYTRTFIGPALSLQGDGSIYHPNLLRYTLLTDGALGWSREVSEGGANDTTTDKLDYYGILSLNVDLLPKKPYNGSAFLDYTHSYRDNDFYSRVLVESWRYGGKLRYAEEPWNLTAGYYHRSEDASSRYPVRFVGPSDQIVITDTAQDSTIDEDTLYFNSRHSRLHGETSLDYYLNSYLRSDFGQTGDGTDQTVTLADAEDLGGLDRFRLRGSASYTRRDNNFETSDEVLALGSFSAEHRENLFSYYDLSYDHFTTGDYLSDSIAGSAALTHVLYDSLSSGLTLRGSDFESSSGGSDGYSRNIGGTLSEDYRKWLSSEHRMNLSAGISLDHTDQQTLGIVQNERHQVLASGEPGAPEPYSFYLNQSNVDPLSIVITDQRDAPPYYVPGFDYQVSQLGSRTLITWLRPLAGPLTVLVDYESEPVPPGSYETLTQNYLLRFELWRNLVGLYSRAGLSDNNARAEMLIQEYWTYAAGADFNYKGLRVGGEYQYYDSTDTDYRSVRLFQSYGFRPDEQSGLSFDFNELWIRYLDLDRREDNYRFMVRYYRNMSYRLGITVEAGTSYLETQDSEQVLATFRPALNYRIGKTTIEAGYDYQYELFLDREERQKHMLYARLKRYF